MKKVIATPELLENILLHTEEKTLLRTKHVCKQFDTLINSSPSLQQRLFVEPHTTGSAFEFQGVLVPQLQVNPLIVAPRRSLIARVLSDEADRLYTEWNLIQEFHNLIRRVPEHQLKRHLNLNEARMDASCRNMSLTNPPVTSIKVLLAYKPRSDIVQKRGYGPGAEFKCTSVKEIVEIKNPNGVQVRQLMSLIEEIGIQGLTEIYYYDTVDMWKQTRKMSAAEGQLFAVDSKSVRILHPDVLITIRHARQTQVTSDVKRIFGRSLEELINGYVTKNLGW